MSRVVLIIEEDFDLRSALCEALEFEGYETLAAADREQALKILGTSEAPSFILLDTPKGFHDPRQFVEEFRRHPAFESIPLIVASSHIHSVEIGRGLSFIKAFDLHLIVMILKEQSLLAELAESP